MTVLAELRGMERAIEREQTKLVDESRDVGHTWREIGQALGISRQSAHKRYAEH